MTKPDFSVDTNHLHSHPSPLRFWPNLLKKRYKNIEQQLLLNICEFCIFFRSYMYLYFIILWNHTYSWGAIFVDCQTFGGSWGHSSWITGLLHYNASNSTIVSLIRVDVNWYVVTHEIHKHWPPTNIEDSTVYAFYLPWL